MTRFDSRDLERLLPELWRVGDEAWTRYRVRKDPLREKIDAATGRRLSEAAMKRAETAVRSLGERFGSAPPRDWAAAMDIAVEEIPAGKGAAPPFLSMAEKRKRRICLCTGALDDIRSSVEAYGLSALAGREEGWRDLLIGHELYHHLEWLEPEAYAPGERVEAWRIGPFAWRSVPAVASEMSALTFSRLAANGKFQPDILELLFLARREPAAALEWAKVAVGEA